MAGDIHIHNNGGTINIGGENAETPFWTPPEVVLPAAPEGSIEAEIRRSGNPGAMADMGYDVHPDAIGEIAEPITDEQRVTEAEAKLEQMDAAEKVSIIRKSYLQKLVAEVDIVRKAEGKLHNPRQEPANRERVEDDLATYTDRAVTTLERACGSCVLRDDCKLEGDLDRWIAVHPYKDPSTDKRRVHARPGSLPESVTEARVTFLKALVARDKYEPEVHCDPNRRTPKPAPLEQSKK